MEVVELSWQEQLFAAQAGCLRRMSAIARGRCEPYETPRVDLWGNDIESCGAEAAVAKILGRYWMAVVKDIRDADGDVSGIEVRSTSRLDGRLIVHDRDRDESVFVLVRGLFPRYEIVGWLLGRDAKQEKYLFGGDGRQAYFVPDKDLNDIGDLLVSGGSYWR